LGKLKIGIALGGGGARGFIHLGVIKALEEKGITPDVISGVSAGAIVGAFIASGKKPDEIMELIKENKFLDYAKVRFPVMGLFTLENFEEHIKPHLSAKSFSDLKIPFYVAVSNLNSGRVEYFNEGPLITAIQASCSIPVLFSPVTINGQLYVDGGLLDNLPYKPLINKCDKIIAISILASEKTNKIENLIEVAARTFEMSVSINREITQRECDLLIEPTGVEAINIFDNSNAEEMFNIGYDYCRKIDNLEREFSE